MSTQLLLFSFASVFISHFFLYNSEPRDLLRVLSNSKKCVYILTYLYVSKGADQSYCGSSLLLVAPSWNMITNPIINCVLKKIIVSNLRINFEFTLVKQWEFQRLKIKGHDLNIEKRAWWMVFPLLFNMHWKLYNDSGFVYFIHITTLHQNSQSLRKAECIVNICFLKINEGFYLKLVFSYYVIQYFDV